MVSVIWNRIGAWLFPGLARERDTAQAALAGYAAQAREASQLAAELAIENRRLKTLVEATRKPEAPKILRPATPAEVRRITEHAFSEEESNV